MTKRIKNLKPKYSNRSKIPEAGSRKKSRSKETENEKIEYF